MRTKSQILHGNSLKVLVTLPDNSVDSIVTDPPYEIGFMGKGWDGSGIAYNVELWEQCLRVLKPGGHLLAFGATRTYHRMTVAIEDAGFEIRDSLHWLYGSGFPKSHNVSKAIDKAAGATRQWSGFGTALKPAHEPIVVARKPLTGTVAANVQEHGTGAINIDGCRVGSYGGTKEVPTGSTGKVRPNTNFGMQEAATVAAGGRWPANLVFTHAADCGDGCAEGCPVAELDGQSGVAVSQQRQGKRTGKAAERYGAFTGQDNVTMGHTDSGGASRFFTTTEWDPTADVPPFRYVAKPSKRERNAGLEGIEEKPGGSLEGGNEKRKGDKPQLTPRANVHPTVKPVALMRWLVRLVTPPGGTVLDPFAGSGTTLVAATLEGFDAIGIEMTEEYIPIIEGRIAWANAQPDKPDELDLAA